MSGVTRTTLLLAAAAVAGFLLARYFFEPVPVEAPAPQPERPSELVSELPDIQLPDLEGQPRRLREWAGKPIIVNFWATWCPPCLKEIPLLMDFADANPDIQVIGIAVDRQDDVERFLETRPIDYPVLIGQSDAMEAANSFGVEFFGLPFTAYVGADGTPLGVVTGEVKQADLDNLAAVIADLTAGNEDNEGAKARLAKLR